MEKLDIDPLWHLHDELTVCQAAALIAGYDPGHVERWLGDPDFDEKFPKLYTAQTALVNAINARNVKAVLRYSAEPTCFAEMYRQEQMERWDGVDAKVTTDLKGDQYWVAVEPSWDVSTVAIAGLREWLLGRGVKSGFFFPEEDDLPNYLDPKHPRFSKKLVAAIKVWMAMEDENLLRATPVIEAMKGWLESRYKELGLIWDGKINKTGIEEIAKVANWKTFGGATKTPSN